MIMHILLLAALATAAVKPEIPAQATPAQTTIAAEPPVQSIIAPAGADVIAQLTAVMAKHPEVQRAYLVTMNDKTGAPRYMLVPIFDRKVSNDALNEAEQVFKASGPPGVTLELMLLARNTWKTKMQGIDPFYVRP